MNKMRDQTPVYGQTDDELLTYIRIKKVINFKKKKLLGCVGEQAKHS